MKVIKLILASLFCVAVLTTALFAVSEGTAVSVPVRINGITADVDARLINSTTYVNLQLINVLLSDASGTSIDISAISGNCYITARGRYIGGADNLVISGNVYVPVRSVAEIYNASVTWDQTSRSADITVGANSGIESGDAYYIQDEIYWMSRIINAEAKGETMRGKILVGNVILNRMFNSEFPDSIYDVIFDTEYGVQFTPVANGTIYDEPSEESIIAAKICLDAYYISHDALYFLNPSAAASTWITQNRSYVTSVGSHDFYA